MKEYVLAIRLTDVDLVSEAFFYASSIMDAKCFCVFDFCDCDTSDEFSTCHLTVACDSPEILFYAGKKFGQLKQKELVQEGSSGSDHQ